MPTPIIFETLTPNQGAVSHTYSGDVVRPSTHGTDWMYSTTNPDGTEENIASGGLDTFDPAQLETFHELAPGGRLSMRPGALKIDPGVLGIEVGTNGPNGAAEPEPFIVIDAGPAVLTAIHKSIGLPEIGNILAQVAASDSVA